MGTFEERLASFHDWAVEYKPRPHILAAAGFYHVSSATDKVVCFCCRLTLEDWERDDDPDMRHLDASIRGRPCEWVRKLQYGPSLAFQPFARPKTTRAIPPSTSWLMEPARTQPVAKKARPVKDHPAKTHKCETCNKKFLSNEHLCQHREAKQHHGKKAVNAGTNIKSKPKLPMLGQYKVAKATPKKNKVKKRSKRAKTMGRPR